MHMNILDYELFCVIFQLITFEDIKLIHSKLIKTVIPFSYVKLLFSLKIVKLPIIEFV